jgi:hypothetical protein
MIFVGLRKLIVLTFLQFNLNLYEYFEKLGMFYFRMPRNIYQIFIYYLINLLQNQIYYEKIDDILSKHL